MSIVVVSSSLIIKKYIGNFLPAVLPPKTNIDEGIKSSEFPLKLPDESRIRIFANGLGKPRDIAFSPGGTLVASLQDTNRVIALPDKNNDAKADQVKTIIEQLNNPHGVTFYKEKLYIVEETQVVRYSWDENSLSATKEKVLFSLPKGGNHTSRTIAFDKKGQMFITLGSTCNVCFEKHEWLAAVIVSDEEGNNPRLFAKGLRNSVFIVVNPWTDELWGTEMGRDFLGEDLPSDEINIIREGKDYGWPICYGDKVYDRAFAQKSTEYCTNTGSPIYKIAAHSAPLGLTFVDSQQFPAEWQGDLLVAYHGSWNRSTPVGYKVVRLDVEGDRIIGEEDFLAGFLQGPQAIGRPVDLAFDKAGNLFISDDKSGVIYQLSGK